MRYVDPYVGTAPSTTLSTKKHSGGTEQRANTIPAVCTPFGMTQWTPQTQRTEAKCLPPYLYKDTLMSGFRGAHWLSGSCVPDYGSVTIMPITGKLFTGHKDVSAAFSHADEITRPDYYRTKFTNNQLTTEITATARCSMMQFTAAADDSLYLLVTPNSDKGKGHVYINRADNEISGYNPAYRIYIGGGKPAGFSGYFAMRIERTIKEAGVFNGAEHFALDSIGDKKDIGGFVGFKVTKGEILKSRSAHRFPALPRLALILKPRSLIGTLMLYVPRLLMPGKRR
ncbi:hypothetical protein [Mucilaginibacter antarcticus]|uniref:hypothetical protein n=1 Tax=Mucilaginibacter antarcticus TaxID=1855725 RepID=UPI00362AA1DC